MVKDIINAFDHMEFCLVINLTMGGNQAVTWQPIIATRYVSSATTCTLKGYCTVFQHASKSLEIIGIVLS